jgi:trimethylamine--corrinoid protein Co-methyltransferase
MPRQPRNLFTDDDLDRLDEAVRRILTRVGMLIQSDRILSVLEKQGAFVDRARQHAMFPQALLDAVIQHAPRMGDGGAAGAVRTPYRVGVGLQVAQFYYDHEKEQRRRAGRDDLVTMIHFGDVWDESLPVDHVLLLGDEPPMVEPLEAVAVLLEHTRRPGNTYAHFAQQFPYLEEMGEIVAGNSKRFLVGGIFMVSPLRMDKRAADFMAARLERGLSCGVGTQPVAGASAPVTAAGVIAQGAAEILAAWCAIHALNPEVELGGCIASGALDMATGNVTFCSPETMLQDLGCVELFRRRYRGAVNVAGASDYTSAKYPGLQAAFEKTLEAMGIAMYTGRAMRMGSGLLESGKTFSPVQLILDKELGSFLWAMETGVEVNADTIALDAIESVASGIGQTHMASEHTLRHFRQALWFPRFLDRSVWQGEAVELQADRRLIEKAGKEFREVLTRYRKPDVDSDMLRRVRAVIDRARRALLE